MRACPLTHAPCGGRRVCFYQRELLLGYSVTLHP